MNNVAKPRNIKVKFWCPIDQDDYLASNWHTHCPLCYNRKEDKHEVIKFEERK